MILAMAVFLGLIYAFWRTVGLARKKNIGIIVRYSRRRPREKSAGTRHVFFTLVDHFEPYWHNRDDRVAMRRVKLWHDGYPAAVEGLADNGGNAPRHTFFYPEEEYRAPILDRLEDLTARRLADVEVHLHHDHDTSNALRSRLAQYRDILHERHGLLHRENGAVRYAFIHGNWALANSMPDGSMCGVDDEVRVLRETGCYADFTYPSAPHPTQPPCINRVYYAGGDERTSRSHHTGHDVQFGTGARDALMLFTGPLTLNWHRRRRGIFPAVENGDITGINAAYPDRVDA